MSATSRLLDEVHDERKRQDELWGEQDYTMEGWIAMLGEEYGESCRAVWDGDEANLREELIQVAAVAINAVESMDKNGYRSVR